LTERAEAELRKLVTELHGSRAPREIGPGTLLERDLGLDSLARMELLTRLEQALAVTLSESAVAAAESVNDLLHAAGVRQPADHWQPVPEAAPEAALPPPASLMTLTSLLDWHVRTHPQRVHIEILGERGEVERLTFNELDHAARALAGGLQYRGVQPGETVVLMLPTGRDYFIAFFGVLRAGAVPVPIYPPSRPAQLEDHLRRHIGILRNSQAVHLIAPAEALAVARLLRSQVESLRAVDTAEALMATGGRSVSPVAQPDDLAFLQYTSGSTGSPKGVMLTHANLLTNIRAMGSVIAAGPGDVFVSWLPLYHDMGLIGAWLGMLTYSAKLVVYSPLQFLARPLRWLEVISRFRGTLSAAPNFGYALCVRRFDGEALSGIDLGSWRCAFNGAEPVSPATLRAFSDTFAPFGFRPDSLMPVYGLAESSLGVTLPRPGQLPRVDRIVRNDFVREGLARPALADDLNPLEFVACGQPLAGHEVRILDTAGQELPERHEGRLQFRGPSATQGYFRNPEATRELLAGDWRNSGDLAYIADGDVVITGRTKDLIIHAGRNIYPQEIEEAVGNLAGVRKGSVAVFTSGREHLEQLVVLAEIRTPELASDDRLRREIATRVAGLAGTPPETIVLAPPHTVPKTSSGKIRRTACRELYERGRIDSGVRPVPVQVARLVLAAAIPECRRAWRALRGFAFAGYAWLVFVLFGLATFLAVMLLPVSAWRWRAMRVGARCAIFATGTRLSVTGLESVPPAAVPCVLAANHMSYLDGMALVAALPHPFGFVAKAEFRHRPLLRSFLQRIGCEFVERFDREQGVADARRLAQLTRHGRSFLYFPEGTFTRVPGLLPFRLGAFSAAAGAGVPIVPVAIHGTRDMLRGDTWYPRHGAIAITVGSPVLPGAAPVGSDTWQTALWMRERTRAWMLQQVREPDLAHELGGEWMTG